MALPQKLTRVAFPTPDAHALCGIALGDTFSSLSLPSFWKDSHSDGKVRYGWLDIGKNGISQICCSVTDTLGRVSRVEVSVEIENETAEQQVFSDLRTLLAQRTNLPGKKEKKRSEWPVAGAYESTLWVR